jgi:hypothetical protein
VALCEEYNIKEKQFRVSDLILSSPKSGFGAICKNGKDF